MGNFQYKSGSNWLDVPDYAHPDDDGGEILYFRPEPTARDGNGAPCGAVGLPSIIVRSRFMRGDGWLWYQSFFSAQTQLSVTITGLTAYDPVTGTWKRCTGRLLRPTGRCTRPTGSATTTYFEEVEIVVDSVTETT